jgi:hypothetical protein
MRRLFAEEGEVRDVQFAARGQRPVPPEVVCRRLVEEVGATLLAARRTARVTLCAVGAGVAVSVVTDAGPLVPAAAGSRDGVQNTPEISTVTVGDDERTWVEARWTPSAS